MFLARILEVAEDNEAIAPLEEWLPVIHMKAQPPECARWRLCGSTTNSDDLVAVLVNFLGNINGDRGAELVKREKDTVLSTREGAEPLVVFLVAAAMLVNRNRCV